MAAAVQMRLVDFDFRRELLHYFLDALFEAVDSQLRCESLHKFVDALCVGVLGLAGAHLVLLHPVDGSLAHSVVWVGL